MSNFNTLRNSKEWPPKKVVVKRSVGVKVDWTSGNSETVEVKVPGPSLEPLNLLNHEQTK